MTVAPMEFTKRPPAKLSPSRPVERNRLEAAHAQQDAERDEALFKRLLDGPALAQPLPPLTYLVPEIGLVAGGGAPHLVAGYGFSGKTLALQSLLLSLAAEVPVWGAYTGRRSRVRHVDLEQGDYLDRARYQRLAFDLGTKLEDLGDALTLLSMPRLTLRPEYQSAWARLMDGCDVIVIDSLRAATPGLDENSSEIREPLDMLGGISNETGCRAMVILHARKPGDDKPGGRYSIRGSGALYDAADVAYIFGGDKGEPVLVTHEKARTDGELKSDFALTFTDVNGGGNPRAGLRVQVHGVELVQDKKAAHARQLRDVAARRDAETLRKVIASSPGIGTSALRELTCLNAARYAAARQILGSAIEVREEQIGRSRTCRHFLTGGLQ